MSKRIWVCSHGVKHRGDEKICQQCWAAAFERACEMQCEPIKVLK